MGHRPHQGALQPVDLLEQLGAQRLLPELGPLEGQCHVIGEGVQQLLVVAG